MIVSNEQKIHCQPESGAPHDVGDHESVLLIYNSISAQHLASKIPYISNTKKLTEQLQPPRRIISPFSSFPFPSYSASWKYEEKRCWRWLRQTSFYRQKLHNLCCLLLAAPSPSLVALDDTLYR